MTTWFDSFKYMRVEDFGAYVRGLNSRIEYRFASLEEEPAKVRRLMDENVLLKNRVAKLEAAVAALEKHTYPLRPRAVKAEDEPHPPCP